MLSILGWVIYGLVVGVISKALHPGDDPVGFLPTVGIGIAGSYVGGLVNWAIGHGDPFQPSGIIMGIVGGVLFCWLYRKWKMNQ